MKPSDLNALEHGHRNRPDSPEKLKEIALTLGLEEGSDNWRRFFDAAARVEELPADVRHMTRRKLVPVLLRTTDDRPMSDDELNKLIVELGGGSQEDSGRAV